MVRIIPMASTLRPLTSSIRFSCLNFRFAAPLPSFSPSHRLSFRHLGCAVPQSKQIGVKPFRLSSGVGNKVSVSAARNMVQACMSATQEEDVLDWVKKDNCRMLHVVYRVGDLDKTIKFYTECFRMKLLRKCDIPEERYTNALLGYGPEDSHFVVELTYNDGIDSYNIGNGFGHFGIVVEDVSKTVDLIIAKGGTVTREPGTVEGGRTVIAFIEDPDGYKFELLERGTTPEPLCQVMLRVGDLDRSIEFYKKAFGMDLLRIRDNPEYKIAVGTDDVYKTAEAIKLCGGKITRETGPLPGISTNITLCLDPNGWKSLSSHFFTLETSKDESVISVVASVQ